MYNIHNIIRNSKKISKKRKRIKKRLDKSIRKLDKLIKYYKRRLSYYKKIASESIWPSKTIVSANNTFNLMNKSLEIKLEMSADDSNENKLPHLNQPIDRNLKFGVPIMHSTPMLTRKVEKSRPNLTNSAANKKEYNNIVACNESLFKTVDLIESDCEYNDDKSNTQSAPKRCKKDSEKSNNPTNRTNIKHKKRNKDRDKTAEKFKKTQLVKRNYNNTNAHTTEAKKSACEFTQNEIEKQETPYYMQDSKNKSCNVSYNNKNKEKMLNQNRKSVPYAKEKSNKNKLINSPISNENLTSSDESTSKNNSVNKLLDLLKDKNVHLVDSDDEINEIRKEIDALNGEQEEINLVNNYIKNTVEKEFSGPAKIFNNIFKSDSFLENKTKQKNNNSNSSGNSEIDLRSEEEDKRPSQSNPKKRPRYNSNNISKYSKADTDKLITAKDTQLVTTLAKMSYHKKKQEQQNTEACKIKAELDELIKHRGSFNNNKEEQEAITKFTSALVKHFEPFKSNETTIGATRDEVTHTIAQLPSTQANYNSKKSSKKTTNTNLNSAEALVSDLTKGSTNKEQAPSQSHHQMHRKNNQATTMNDLITWEPPTNIVSTTSNNAWDIPLVINSEPHLTASESHMNPLHSSFIVSDTNARPQTQSQQTAMQAQLQFNMQPISTVTSMNPYMLMLASQIQHAISQMPSPIYASGHPYNGGNYVNNSGNFSNNSNNINSNYSLLPANSSLNHSQPELQKIGEIPMDQGGLNVTQANSLMFNTSQIHINNTQNHNQSLNQQIHNLTPSNQQQFPPHTPTQLIAQPFNPQTNTLHFNPQPTHIAPITQPLQSLAPPTNPNAQNKQSKNTKSHQNPPPNPPPTNPPPTNPPRTNPPRTNPPPTIPPPTNPPPTNPPPTNPPPTNPPPTNPPPTNQLPPLNQQQNNLAPVRNNRDNELRFRVVLSFAKDLNRSKWDSRSTIFNEINMSFAAWDKKFEGPIEAYLKDTKTIIIIGERASDYDLFNARKWSKNVFDATAFAIKLNTITPDVPEVMLMGTTRTNISPKGEEELKKSYNISRITSKGGNKYELKFIDATARNLAMELGFIASAGVKIRVSDWKRVLEISQCHKCQKYGHFKAECKSRSRYGNCKFCGALDSNHESGDCPDIHIYEHHRCSNCRDMRGFKTHNAGEKMKCEHFMNYYFSRCDSLKFKPEEKYIECHKKIKERDGTLGKKGVNNGASKKDINLKMLQQMNLNRKLFGEDIINYTAVCESELDESLMNLYHEMKVNDEEEEDSSEVGEN
jgi:hypothetical protein